MRKILLLAVLFCASPSRPEPGAAPPKPQTVKKAYDLFDRLKKQSVPTEQAIRVVSERLHLSFDEVSVILGAARQAPVDTPDPTPSAGVGQPGIRREIALGLDELAKRLKPGDPGVFRGSGQDRLRAGDPRGAYDDFRRAYALGDRSAPVSLGISAAALQLGDYATATDAARQVLDQDPKNQEALFLYNDAKGRAPADAAPSPAPPPGDASAGAASASPAPASPTSVSAAAPVGAAIAGDAPERSRERAKDSADALRVRDYSGAYRLAAEAVSLNPQNAQALNFRAMALTQMGRYPEAVQDASASLELAPGSLAALHTRSWAFNKEGRYREALADAESAEANDPSNALIEQDKAFALAGLGDRAGAVEALRRAAALDARFQSRLERALQLPRNADMTLLFDDGSSSAAAAAPVPRPIAGRFLRLVALTAVGGILIALGLLHVLSASWRDRTRMTIRRVLGSAPKIAPVEALATGIWSQYTLVREIGLGGMGVVYEGLDRSLGRRVAIKKMRDEIRLDPQERARFVGEARLVAQLHHPNIVEVYGIVEEGIDVFLVFEYVDGRTLEDALKSGGPMDLVRARAVVREAAAAVAHAHGRGVIHRDLKPSNVMIASDGRVKVMDFGVARRAKDALSRLSMTNTVVGTPPYMAPEQEQGVVRPESDVYALGVCLYEMTTGRLPFVGSGGAMLLAKINGQWVPPSRLVPSLTAAFDAVIARALAPDPEKRFKTPQELAAALEAA